MFDLLVHLNCRVEICLRSRHINVTQGLTFQCQMGLKD